MLFYELRSIHLYNEYLKEANVDLWGLSIKRTEINKMQIIKGSKKITDTDISHILPSPIF